MRILVAVDGSTYSEDAVHSIAERPWPAGTRVRIVHAIRVFPPISDFGVPTNVPPLGDQFREEGEAMVASASARLRAAGFHVETAVVDGDARSAIIDEAKTWSADLIVLGSHGYTGITRWLLGSVAQSVVAHAPCSVEVVRRKLSETA